MDLSNLYKIQHHVNMIEYSEANEEYYYDKDELNRELLKKLGLSNIIDGMHYDNFYRIESDYIVPYFKLVANFL